MSNHLSQGQTEATYLVPVLESLRQYDGLTPQPAWWKSFAADGAVDCQPWLNLPRELLAHSAHRTGSPTTGMNKAGGG